MVRVQPQAGSTRGSRNLFDLTGQAAGNRYWTGVAPLGAPFCVTGTVAVLW
jgi:hypothetical protein